MRHNGDLVYLIAIHTKSSCTPNFENDDVRGDVFPFNVQTCKLRFGSWINEQYQVAYRLPTDQSDVNLDTFSHPTGWDIVAMEAELESIHYPMFYEPSHHVVFTFSAKRKFFYDPASGMLWKVRIDAF